ncbi:zinc-binding dehydrogenase [Streptomyces anulatus]|uniref:zinc-binding dehydrogenase n=1 Tax=Streptomyces anulatus TaxID=1892 RepID=UPI000A3DE4F8|nr:zinc-binding dehydrogenase [Streptomyces anulatus]
MRTTDRPAHRTRRPDDRRLPVRTVGTDHRSHLQHRPDRRADRQGLGAGQVIATTRSAAKHDLLKRAGADTVVVTGERDLIRAVIDATGADGVDVVFDYVGRPAFAACLPATRVDGGVVNIGRLDTAESTVDLDALSYRYLRVAGAPFGFALPAELGAVIATAGEQLLSAVTDGRASWDGRAPGSAVTLPATGPLHPRDLPQHRPHHPPPHAGTAYRRRAGQSARSAAGCWAAAQEARIRSPSWVGEPTSAVHTTSC